MRRLLPRHAHWGLLAALAALLLTAALVRAPLAHANFPTGHDNSTNPGHDLQWTHADPNSEVAPGTSTGYYYLKAYASGPFVYCTVFSAENWHVELVTPTKVILAQANFANSGGRVFITNATAGNLYECRIANNSPSGGSVQKDYAELNSGAIGDPNIDCGGPGPVWDPNFDAAPMQPAPTPGMPAVSCATPQTVAYTPGDKRLAPPAGAVTYNLGAITGSQTWTITTSVTGDLTAGAFFGNQGVNGTLEITNATGTVVNGEKWGDNVPNPKTMNQEFVGVDAGVEPPGTYKIVYTGPANSTQVAHALLVPYPQALALASPASPPSGGGVGGTPPPRPVAHHRHHHRHHHRRHHHR